MKEFIVFLTPFPWVELIFLGLIVIGFLIAAYGMNEGQPLLFLIGSLILFPSMLGLYNLPFAFFSSAKESFLVFFNHKSAHLLTIFIDFFILD